VIPTDELGGWFPPRNRKVLDNRQQEREMQQGRDKRVRDRLASWSGSDANYEHNDNRRLAIWFGKQYEHRVYTSSNRVAKTFSKRAERRLAKSQLIEAIV
jgi:hypothetical protein